MAKNSKSPSPNPGRRKFLKRSAIVAGAAGAVAIGGIGFSEVLGSKQSDSSTSSSSSSGTAAANSPNKTISADALVAYAYLGPQGNVSTTRDDTGNITQVNYGPLTIQITRNSDGTVSSIQTSVPSDSIDVVDTIVRNPDGSISGVNRAWPS